MGGRSVRRLAAAGSTWLVAFGCVAVFAPLAQEGSVRTGSTPTGEVVVRETSAATSLWASQHGPAATVLAGVVAFAAVAYALVVHGGRVGGVLVVAVAGLGTFASILSVGIFLAPGAVALCVAAVLAEADRAERRRLGRLPPPPGYRAADALAHLDP